MVNLAPANAQADSAVIVSPGEQGFSDAPLPASLTSFVGRVADVERIVSLIHQDGVRLVTLTGPGGVGKTRLALRVAERLKASFSGAVAFIPLATISEPDFVGATIARALGVHEAHGYPLAHRLAAVVGDQKVLLVLDNFASK